MKKLLLCITLLFIKNIGLDAQTINTTHLFSGTPVKYLSKGTHKLGWVSENGSYYASNIMDSLQNIITVPDSSLSIAPFGFPATTGGVTLCGSILDQNDNLKAMFYDWNCWIDTNMVQFPYFGNGCYFLYDFNTQQRHYFYFNTNTFVQPQEPNTDCDYHLNWKNDTLVITLQFYDQSQSAGGISWGNCVKFYNNQVIEEGVLPVDNYVIDVFIDSTGKVNHLYDNMLGGSWWQSDGLNYNTNVTPANTTFYGDAFVKSNDLYLLQNHFSFIGESDSILNYNGVSQSAIISPMIGVYSRKAMCVDHANRIWVAKADSVYMYNGNSWIAFDFGGINLQSSLMNPSIMKSFIEYKNNCYALCYSEDLLPTGGNGMLLFCYNDSTIVTSNRQQLSSSTPSNQINIFPNPAANFIHITNLQANDRIIIKNLLGKEIYSENVSQSQYNIETTGISNGLYLIDVKRNNGIIVTQKVIITKN